VAPLFVAARVSAEVLATVCDRIRRHDQPDAVPLWCPWPLPTGWTVTGVGWVGDDRRAPLATAVTISGPAPFSAGPADIVLVAEQVGTGLGGGLAGFGAVDAGPGLPDLLIGHAPDAKVRTDGHPTPLWSVPSDPDRSVHVGEARAMWLYAITWPAAAAYLIEDGLRLHDLADTLPGELVYGADSGRLRPVPAGPLRQPTAHPLNRPYGTARPVGPDAP
jgi:hypothetical protein